MFLVPVVQVGSPRHGTGSIPAGRWVACTIGCLISPLRASGAIPFEFVILMCVPAAADAEFCVQLRLAQSLHCAIQGQPPVKGDNELTQDPSMQRFFGTVVGLMFL